MSELNIDFSPQFTLNFTVVENTDCSASVERRETSSTGPVVDMTGYSAKLDLKEDEDDDVFFEMSTANGRIEIDGPNGRIKFVFNAADTSPLTINEVLTMKGHLELTDALGDVKPWAYVNVTFIPEWTT